MSELSISSLTCWSVCALYLSISLHLSQYPLPVPIALLLSLRSSIPSSPHCLSLSYCSCISICLAKKPTFLSFSFSEPSEKMQHSFSFLSAFYLSILPCLPLSMPFYILCSIYSSLPWICFLSSFHLTLHFLLLFLPITPSIASSCPISL